METDMLDEYLGRPVEVRFTAQPAVREANSAEGLLTDYSALGILLEQEESLLTFIPMAAIRMIHIKAKPSFWQRLTGSS